MRVVPAVLAMPAPLVERGRGQGEYSRGDQGERGERERGFSRITMTSP